MTRTELLYAYEEYCIDCYYEGRIPQPYHKWIEGRE